AKTRTELFSRGVTKQNRERTANPNTNERRGKNQFATEVYIFLRRATGKGAVAGLCHLRHKFLKSEHFRARTSIARTIIQNLLQVAPACDKISSVRHKDSFMPRFRPNVEAMAAYVPGEQPPAGAKVTKLNTNENPYPPSPKVAEAIRAELGETGD